MAMVSANCARSLGDQVGVNWRKVDLKQFRMGIQVEKEHCKTVHKDMQTVARIARDHLLEIPDYYTRLLKMEHEAEHSSREGPEPELASAAVTILELYDWLRRKKVLNDLAIYTQWDWRVREGQDAIGAGAPITITAEGNELMYGLNYGETKFQRKLVDEFTAFVEERGYYWELGYSWSCHLYPITQTPKIQRSRRK